MFEFIPKMGIAVSYGSGALKALQNDTMPELDLLVREAIQNSSDASIKVKAEESFAVNFNVGSFDPVKFNSLLPSVRKELDSRYSDEPAKFIEIRDYKTEGLTGHVRVSDIKGESDHGNYFKLVFDTGKEQSVSEEGAAGGSWGYGKSVYFRVGIGVVVFYSRIKVDVGFEERLIISLVEHESQDAALLRSVRDDAIGRAWWGEQDPDDPDGILPITDSDKIQTVLDIFGINRFNSKQTGTSIIIPYVDEDRLLYGLIPDESGISDEEKSMCFWKDSLSEYIKLAVQKWYAPKIFNKDLKVVSSQKWLAVRVNGEAIKYDSMRPLFQLIQDLYTTALYGCYNEAYISANFDGIKTVSIPSQRVEGGKSGCAAYITINQQQLSPEGMLKPYTYLRLFSRSSSNDPIVMFARTPGMVLDYKIDGKWAKGLIKPESEDEYMFVFYVPSCSLKLKNDPMLGKYAGESLGEYLRSCEKSDHMDWTDNSTLTVITNIKNQVVNKVNAEIKKEEQPAIAGSMSRLSGRLGKVLLPPINYGKRPSGGGSGSGSGGSGPKTDNLMTEFKPHIRAEGMIIDFSFTFQNTRKSVDMGIFVETENGVIDASTWESELKTDYPIEIYEISNIKTEAINSKRIQFFEEACNKITNKVKNDFTEVELIYTKSEKSIRGFRIRNSINNALVTGELVLKTNNRKYVCTIKEI